MLHSTSVFKKRDEKPDARMKTHPADGIVGVESSERARIAGKLARKYQQPLVEETDLKKRSEWRVSRLPLHSAPAASRDMRWAMRYVGGKLRADSWKIALE